MGFVPDRPFYGLRPESLLRRPRALRPRCQAPSVLPTSVTISYLVPSSPCVFACSRRAVCLVSLSSNAVISASAVITFWGSVQVVKSTRFASSSSGVRSCLRWWVWSCCSPPISSGAFLGFRSSTVGQTHDAWVMRCALGDHLNSTVNSAVPVVGAFSGDMGPCIGGRIRYYHTFWGMPDLYVHCFHTRNM